MRTIRFGVFVVFVVSPQLATAGEDVTESPRPEPIIGGQRAATCAWPTVVRLGGCTGNLVHPEVVIYAAHCGRPGSVTFTEAGGGLSVGAQCQTYPGYDDTQGTDWAVCRLSEPVNLPVTPIIYGCELDMLGPGTEVAIVGFGATSDAGGFGTKYWADTYINVVEETTIGVGGQGIAACPGDSGGPLMVQLADGSYRTAGITSTYGGTCGTPNVYARPDKALPWFESVVGIDLTPCHDSATGDWDPGPDCTGFYAGGSEGSGNWGSAQNSCGGTPASGPSDSCGDPFGAGDEDPPTVSITSPADGAVVDPAPVEIAVTVDASDADSGVAGVWLEIDGAMVGQQDTTEPWEFSGVSFPPGEYTIVAVAEDAVGNQASSDPVTITAGMDPPGGTDETGDDPGTSDDGDPSTDTGWDEDPSDPGADGPGGDGSGGEGTEGGCGCAATPSALSSLAVAALLVLPLARRRRLPYSS